MNTTTPTAEQKMETFQQTLRFRRQAGERAVAEFSESVEKYGLLYALQWADSQAVTQAVADLWARVDMLYSGENQLSPRQAVEAVLEEVTRQLLRNYVHQSSTSRFSNAAAAANAEAHARFHEEATGLIAFLSK